MNEEESTQSREGIVFADGPTLERLLMICLALPEATEGAGVGNPSFRVRDKIFAMQHGVNGRPSLWVKSPKGVQEGLVKSDPERYFVPPYVGHHGWVGIRLDGEVDWGHAADLIEAGYRMTAPKRLFARLDG
jgi:predicted DNA-binding protein (MmcQ/YjbR family)